MTKPSSPAAPKFDRRLILLLGLAVLVWWVRYHPLGVKGLVLEDDTRQHVYWTATYQDPDLFPDDPMTRFASSVKIAPPGYRSVYRLGVSFTDPLPFSRWLCLFLLLVTLWLFDRLLRFHVPGGTERLLVEMLFLFYLAHNVVHNVLGGFQRSFAFPLLLGFLVLLMKGYYRPALGVAFVEAVFYPAILPNTLALAGARLLEKWRQVGINKALVVDGLFLAGTTALCGLFLNVIYWMTGDSFAGEPMTLEVARSMPEFHLGGRTVFFRENLPAYFLTGRSGIGVLHLSGFIVITALMGFVLNFRQLEIPTLSFHLIWTSLVLFILAHLVLFRLYLPSRYTYYTLSLALLLIIGANLRPFMDRLKNAMPRLWDVVGRIPKGVKGAVAAALLLAYILAQSFLICRIDPRLVVLDPPDLEMLHFLQTLPKDSLVAGHPNVMDNVPLVAKRKVVANTELALPYYTGYYNWIKPRLADSLRAYYAADEKQLRAFLDDYGVNALVVRRSHFDKALLDGVITYEPFNTEIKKRLGKNPEFVLSPAPRKDRCFENERYVVLCFPEKN